MDAGKLGFTGTRDGMTDAQKGASGIWRYGRRFTEFHHGCCVGADALAVLIVTEEAYDHPKIVGHPCDWPAMQDKEACARSAIMLPARKPLDRNRDIVDAVDLLLACPKGPEELRSGTWATIRFARRQGKPVVIFWPDGKIG